MNNCATLLKYFISDQGTQTELLQIIENDHEKNRYGYNGHIEFHDNNYNGNTTDNNGINDISTQKDFRLRKSASYTSSSTSSSTRSMYSRNSLENIPTRIGATATAMATSRSTSTLTTTTPTTPSSTPTSSMPSTSLNGSSIQQNTKRIFKSDTIKKWQTTIESISYVTTKTVNISDYPTEVIKENYESKKFINERPVSTFNGVGVGVGVGGDDGDDAIDVQVNLFNGLKEKQIINNDNNTNNNNSNNNNNDTKNCYHFNYNINSWHSSSTIDNNKSEAIFRNS